MAKDTTALPFSQSGKPVTPPTGPAPRNFVENNTGSGDATPPRDVQNQKPERDANTPGGSYPHFRPERKQTPVTFKERVNTSELPADASPHPVAQSPRGGTGSLGNAARPFKGLK